MNEQILSAGVVVVRRADEGWRVLLLRVYNYWDFPKGRVEPGEDALTTARRETREETTIADLDFAWGTKHIDTAPYGREKKVARYYVARTATEAISLPVNPSSGSPSTTNGAGANSRARAARARPAVPVLRWAQDLID
jgi:bis(5'-nucleosidyl)-tetraphosphatase